MVGTHKAALFNGGVVGDLLTYTRGGLRQVSNGGPPGSTVLCELTRDFSQSILHRVWPKTLGSEEGSMFALIVVARVFSWPPVRLCHV